MEKQYFNRHFFIWLKSGVVLKVRTIIKAATKQVTVIAIIEEAQSRIRNLIEQQHQH